MHFLSRLVHRFSTVATSTSNVGSISTDLYKEKDLKRLVDKFKRYSDLERFRTKTGIYKETVRRLANAKRFRWIEEILEHQKQYKDVSKEGFSVRLVALYGQADLPKKLGIEPDQVSYNTVVKAYCEMGSLDSAIMLLDDMEKKGVEPDRITFNTLLHAFYMNGRFGAAEMIWERMANRNITPDIRSYNAKLYGLAMEKRTKEAVELVEEMRYKTIKPDVFSFNALIKGFVNEGKLEEAKWWYDEIEKSDCAINKGTFTILVPLVCEKGDLDFAFELCKKIFGRRCLVDEELLQLVLDSLVKESKIEEAKELVELSKTNDYCRYNLKFSSNE
ncbi:pentatricopeptide repeat-containing protein At3g13160, mitochondrial-like isoform X2 [Mangifera indica]|uniref:pentatricopeptide repeat-containing protein At3g13160, mitochondrial-like isoform X2 n=1 Tax=Mangifera indica TaxID=29780 RepID=UPI001CFC2F63|nr:pentatricopeptide repeat-containing protein At3g13160, mitochondrial-like isoform X2 [Mangifera indica]